MTAEIIKITILVYIVGFIVVSLIMDLHNETPYKIMSYATWWPLALIMFLGKSLVFVIKNNLKKKIP